MAGVNKAIILGNLGRDPEMTYTPSGLAVCKFSLATSKKMKDGQNVTQWHRCTAFGKAGELIAQYVNKGNQLYVEGEINYSQYEPRRRSSSRWRISGWRSSPGWRWRPGRRLPGECRLSAGWSSPGRRFRRVYAS